MKTNYRLPVRANGIKTFNEIINSAKKLFAVKGYSNTSINEIIETAGIATGTFYQYFDDKYAVYEFLLFQYQKEIRRSIGKAISGYKTRYDLELYGLIDFIKFICNDRLAFKIIWESMFIDVELFREYYKGFASNYVNQLQKSVLKGEVRDDIDLETAAYALMGISNFVGLQAIFLSNDDVCLSNDKIEKLAREAMKLIDRGVLKNEEI